MEYRIQRDGQEYGPYRLADLQMYVQSGNISPQDLAQSEGMGEWIPVSKILGDIPISVAPIAVPAADASLQPFVLLPPNLPWVVLLIGYLSVVIHIPGLRFFLAAFILVWKLIQAFWANRLSGKNTALVLVAMDVAGYVLGTSLAWRARGLHVPGLAGFGGLLLIAAVICSICASFSIRNAMERYYNTVEPIGLIMSGVMVFFFNYIYIQFHINRIARWKKTGVLT